MTAQTNGGPDWALAFAEFHARHRDVKGKKLVFTAIFNAAMDAFITCPEVPLVWRVLAWIWRCSWGNDSDYCVDGIGGSPLGQQACADQFGVDKRRVHDCVTLLRGLNFILPPNGHKLYPIDDPSQPPQKDPTTTDVESPGPSGLFTAFCDEWKVRDLADFQELESHEAAVNRIKIVRLGKYKEWLKGRSNHAQTIKPNLQQVVGAEYSIMEPLPTNRPLLAVGRSVEDLEEKTPEPEPPKPPPLSEAKPLPEIGPLATDTREWLVKTYALPTAPSTEVLAELARLCRDEAGFEQFKTECAKTQNADPKSYRYFLPIARRCAEHRPEYEEALRSKKEAKPATNGFDEERLRRIVANVEESRKWR